MGTYKGSLTNGMPIINGVSIITDPENTIPLTALIRTGIERTRVTQRVIDQVIKRKPDFINKSGKYEFFNNTIIQFPNGEKINIIIGCDGMEEFDSEVDIEIGMDVISKSQLEINGPSDEFTFTILESVNI